MAIRNVGGQSVYVIEAQPVAAAKTSTGTGYAQLVSQLRWQIWEEAQKQVLRELEFEKMTYASQLETYKNQQEQLARQLAKARELKFKSESGAITPSEMAKAVRFEAELQYKYDALNARLAREGRTKVISSPVYDIAGDPVVDDLGNPVTKRTTVSYEEGKEPVKKLGIRKSADILGAARQADEEKKAEKVEAAPDASIDDLISQLEQERFSILPPTVGFDTNILSRTREQFGGMAGVGGFGFAPRPSKISPIYDEGRAKEALASFQPAAESVILQSAAKKAADQEAALLSARSGRALELQAAGATQEQIDALKTLTPEEKSSIQRGAIETAQKEFREAALSAGPGERTAGTFMDVPRPEPVVRPDFVREERQKRDFNFPEIKGLDRFQYPEGTVPTSEFGVTGTGESGLGFRGGPEVRRTRPIQNAQLDLQILKELMKDESVRPSFDVGASGEAGLGFEQPKPKPVVPTITPPPPPVQPKVDAGDIELEQDISKAAELTPEQAKTPEQRKAEEQTKRSNILKEFAIQYAPIKVNADTGSSEIIPVDPKINEQIFKMFIEEGPTFESDAAGRSWYKGKLDEITGATPAQGKAKPKTRTEKYASASLSILKKGSELADKPSKLARLAKLDLPEKERKVQVPEHILLVDKLYQINKGKTNAYKSTFDEIARVYSKDDKKKKEAQEYLTATHLLYTEGLV